MLSHQVEVASDFDQPIAPMEVIISILVQDPDLHERCQGFLANPAGLRKLANLLGPTLSFEVNHENPPNQGAELLKQLFRAPGRVVIVISDLMAEPPRGGEDGPAATDWWSQVVAASSANQDRIGSVAITGWAPRRVPDVDRVVGPDLAEPALFDAIARTVRTLDYKQKPQPRKLQELVVIRHVRTKEELKCYYRLRHRIYSLMGYLDHEVEGVPIEREIDWCDLFSIPIAAFVAEPSGAERMIGTTRIIGTRDYAPRLSSATEEIAAEDETGILTGKLNQIYRFQMPFLQSHPDPQILTKLNKECPDAFCEISRVIVDRDHRGMGISKILMSYAMAVARRMGMKRIFLECLPAHRELYESFRFRLVQGRRDRVYNINKTMDLMEWDGPAHPNGSSLPLRGQSEMERLRECGYLCLCENSNCPGGDRGAAPNGSTPRYPQFLQWLCPLAANPAPWLVTPEDKHVYRQWPGMETYDDYED
ncbi:MAG TPA: GNAT family N-acetyltransferase [Isosphaeraceae bacterium]|jgi:GNAT superfamily N-acetyltransferase|nr:GNAT family N-acetyltransferase [Isosphaeraceae bacterium]